MAAGGGGSKRTPAAPAQADGWAAVSAWCIDKNGSAKAELVGCRAANSDSTRRRAHSRARARARTPLAHGGLTQGAVTWRR